MIKFAPTIDKSFHCPICNVLLKNNEKIIQGIHVCVECFCSSCNETFLFNLPIGQGKLNNLCIRKSDGYSFTPVSNKKFFNSFSAIYNNSNSNDVSLEIIKRNFNRSEVVILNTLDDCYGHSLLRFFNLQNIIENKNTEVGIIVIIQPFLKWLLPKEGIDEIWIVNMSFRQMNYFYTELNRKIKVEIDRFTQVSFSEGHLCPKNIKIEEFSKIRPYDFDSPPKQPRISIIWRQDVNRLWIKSYWIYGIMRKIGIAKILLPLNYLRYLTLVFLLKYKFKGNYKITILGLGTFGIFPKFVDDKRLDKFNEINEFETTEIYSESTLVIGIHGSSLILPSAHAGMTISIMPVKRWGNFAEDLIFSEDDLRLAFFQKRIIPIKISLFEILDICESMLKGRGYFINKFLYLESDL